MAKSLFSDSCVGAGVGADANDVEAIVLWSRIVRSLSLRRLHIHLEQFG